MDLPETPWIHTLRFVLEIAATVAFALSGMVAAARQRMDAVGVCVVAFVAAFGGGTLRDLLLDQRPFFWVRHTGYVWGILALCVGAMLFMRQRHLQPTERAMLLPDAIGLGLFAAVGVDIATAAGMPPLIGVMMGVTTGVFGGVLRDIFCNQVPLTFLPSELYATASWIGSLTLIGLQHYGVDATLAAWIGLAMVFLLRAAAIHFRIKLPTFQA